jgi:hypothetical protein
MAADRTCREIADGYSHRRLKWFATLLRQQVDLLADPHGHTAAAAIAGDEPRNPV